MTDKSLDLLITLFIRERASEDVKDSLVCIQKSKGWVSGIDLITGAFYCGDLGNTTAKISVESSKLIPLYLSNFPKRFWVLYELRFVLFFLHIRLHIGMNPEVRRWAHQNEGGGIILLN